MSDSLNVMTASKEKTAWSTSGYLIFLLFLALLVLTIWRIVAFALHNAKRQRHCIQP